MLVTSGDDVQPLVLVIQEDIVQGKGSLNLFEMIYSQRASVTDYLDYSANICYNLLSIRVIHLQLIDIIDFRCHLFSSFGGCVEYRGLTSNPHADCGRTTTLTLFHENSRICHLSTESHSRTNVMCAYKESL